MGPINYAPPEPPLPAELQKEIEASVQRFRQMFPTFFRSAAEEYVPAYRAEITSLVRKAMTHLMRRRTSGTALNFDSEIAYLEESANPPRAETPVQPETKDHTGT